MMASYWEDYETMMKGIVVVLAMSAGAYAQPGSSNASPTATFRSAVSNVKIDVQVTNKTELVRDLTLKDFVLFDQDRQRELLYVDHGSEPLSLVLLLDVSGSMRKHVEAIAGVALSSLRFLQSSDSISVIVFGTRTKVRLPLTTDREKVESEIKEAINDQDVGAETMINDAIVVAADYLDKQASASRRAILILTDNLGMNIRNPDENVIDRLLANNCVLNAIVVGVRFRPDPTKPRPTSKPDHTLPNVYYIAQETGGEAVQVEDAGKAFPSMVERIRLRYSLQYKTPAGVTGTFRKIRVELTPGAQLRYPDAKLRYRRGYYFAR
jgi:VWFA-related protein